MSATARQDAKYLIRSSTKLIKFMEFGRPDQVSYPCPSRFTPPLPALHLPPHPFCISAAMLRKANKKAKSATGESAARRFAPYGQDRAPNWDRAAATCVVFAVHMCRGGAVAAQWAAVSELVELKLNSIFVVCVFIKCILIKMY